jgi:sensor c-di-GMP phosphodiesterase-like protein
VAYQQTIAAMQSEKNRLTPLLNADRATVTAIFKEQAARNQQAQQRERLIGFGLGIVSSLSATALWWFGIAVLKRRRVARAAGT